MILWNKWDVVQTVVVFEDKWVEFKERISLDTEYAQGNTIQFIKN